MYVNTKIYIVDNSSNNTDTKTIKGSMVKARFGNFRSELWTEAVEIEICEKNNKGMENINTKIVWAP